MQKLALLARLQRRYIECRLPQESESRVEQSFNEQLFAKVLGYRTLLSHDALPYHLRPKNYARVGGRRRYDDFSLGAFWGDQRDIVVASAEFKDPGADLDAPQKDRKDKITPVAQAFRAARRFPRCTWVLVSNFRELRLYHISNRHHPLVAIDLHEIRTPRQLATLRAYFDHEALIGNKGTPEMAIALDPKHPSAPLPPARGHFRLIGTFTPTQALDVRLCELFDTTRAAIAEVFASRGWGLPEDIPTEISDGWCVVQHGPFRLAVSTEGQFRWSNWRIFTDSSIFLQVALDVYGVLLVVQRFYGLLHPQHKGQPGIVNFELQEAEGRRVLIREPALIKRNEQNGGVAPKDELLSGDLPWQVHVNTARAAADCMGELALQFQAGDGRRVRFNHAGLAELLERPA